jgi:hypothetical protein
MQNSPREWFIVLILFLPVMSLPQRGAAWGVGFVFMEEGHEGTSQVRGASSNT